MTEFKNKKISIISLFRYYSFVVFFRRGLSLNLSKKYFPYRDVNFIVFFRLTIDTLNIKTFCFEDVPWIITVTAVLSFISFFLKMYQLQDFTECYKR